MDGIQITPKLKLPDAHEVARLILSGFDRHYALFRYGAQRAKSLYESGDFKAIQQLSAERIEYYDRRVRECAAKLQAHLPKALFLSGGADTHIEQAQTMGVEAQAFWQGVRQNFVGLLNDHRQPECAETFYNSVSSKVLHRDYYHNDFLFVRPAIATDYLDSERPVYRVYYPIAEGARKTAHRIIADFGLACGFRDLPHDSRLLTRRATRMLRCLIVRTGGHRLSSDCQIHVLGSLFFRGCVAYAVGQLINQGITYPFAIALTRSVTGRVEVDALLSEQTQLSALFSFTRAYFLVDMEVPAAYVQFISRLLPGKPKAEIYTMLGLHKQGKTLFYRDFLQHLAHSHDHFDVAPGIRGMVMGVFTLPSYPYVFKLIKDNIAKEGMTANLVRSKYQLVKLHDRVGRLADTWEYSQVALPRARFSDALIQELQTIAPNQVTVKDELLVFKHLYIERRMIPLNLYLKQASALERAQAVRDYGYAIRELAAANIFPGDMLYKNFGLTRSARVVFYDYDEIQTMMEMNFRDIPPAPNEEAELASEPWYAVHPNDVFPEEFGPFLLGDPAIRSIFLAHHADLLTATWWQQCREQIARGVLTDPLSYPSETRLKQTTESRRP